MLSSLHRLRQPSPKGVDSAFLPGWGPGPPRRFDAVTALGAETGRAWMATVLTAQIGAGAALGIAAQVFLVWVVIRHVMPRLGAALLDMARDVADFNLPARVGQLFGVGL
jgi:hypothetical protein